MGQNVSKQNSTESMAGIISLLLQTETTRPREKAEYQVFGHYKKFQILHQVIAQLQFYRQPSLANIPQVSQVRYFKIFQRKQENFYLVSTLDIISTLITIINI